jgi:hypothetical protein
MQLQVVVVNCDIWRLLYNKVYCMMHMSEYEVKNGIYVTIFINTFRPAAI